MKLFCENCETQIFETDRICPSCGASIKNLFSVKKEKSWIEPKITCFGYDKNDEITFKGIVIADYKLKINSNPTKDGKLIYYHNQYPDVDVKITDIEWLKEEKIIDDVIKSVLNVEIVKENIIKNTQIIIPLSKVINFNDDEINLRGLYYVPKNSTEPICFYRQDIE